VVGSAGWRQQACRRPPPHYQCTEFTTVHTEFTPNLHQIYDDLHQIYDDLYRISQRHPCVLTPPAGGAAGGGDEAAGRRARAARAAAGGGPTARRQRLVRHARRLAAQPARGRLRPGPPAIIPPHSHLYVKHVNVTNNSAPCCVHRPTGGGPAASAAPTASRCSSTSRRPGWRRRSSCSWSSWTGGGASGEDGFRATVQPPYGLLRTRRRVPSPGRATPSARWPTASWDSSAWPRIGRG
jgi:hypothetical protein